MPQQRELKWNNKNWNVVGGLGDWSEVSGNDDLVSEVSEDSDVESEVSEDGQNGTVEQ